jgi:hypothetical protein
MEEWDVDSYYVSERFSAHYYINKKKTYFILFICVYDNTISKINNDNNYLTKDNKRTKYTMKYLAKKGDDHYLLI